MMRRPSPIHRHLHALLFFPFLPMFPILGQIAATPFESFHTWLRTPAGWTTWSQGESPPCRSRPGDRPETWLQEKDATRNTNKQNDDININNKRNVLLKRSEMTFSSFNPIKNKPKYMVWSQYTELTQWNGVMWRVEQSLPVCRGQTLQLLSQERINLLQDTQTQRRGMERRRRGEQGPHERAKNSSTMLLSISATALF